MKPLRAICLLLLLVVKMPASEAAQGDTGITFAEASTALVIGFESIDRFEIYEGLPRSFGDKNALEAKGKTKAAIQIDDQWFYPQAQEGRLEEALELQLSLSGHLLRPWSGLKFCGGFHADFAVHFTSGKSAYWVLFCFGCHEARIIRTSQPFRDDIRIADFRLTTDIDPVNFEKLRALLIKYRNESPGLPAGPSSR